MLDLISEIKQSLRSLLRDRAFTFFSVLAFSLGLGLNGAILVLSRSFLLKNSPVKNAEQLWDVKDVITRPGPIKRDLMGSTDAYTEMKNLPCFEQMALSVMRHNSTWNHPGGIEEIQVMEATHEYLPILGLQVHLGRFFNAQECGVGAPEASTAVISHRFWKQNLQGKPDILGQLVQINGKAHTIIGVLLKGFQGHTFHQGADIVVPWVDTFRHLPPSKGGRGMAQVLARLKPGYTLEQAKAAVATLDWGDKWRLELHPYSPMPMLLKQKLSRGLGMLHVAALLILGIGLANVLALQIVRFQRRQNELALRLALGARGAQLFRLIALENLILAILAGGAAIGMATFASPLLEAIQAIMPYPPKVQTRFGIWTGAATLLVSILLGLLLSVVVYGQARRMDLANPLKQGRTHTQGLRLRGLLVAFQAALALVMLTSAGLCLKDLQRQLNIPLGMEIEGRYLLECEPRKVGRKDEDLLPILPPLKERLRQLPGVKAVALTQGGPVRGISTTLGGKTTTSVIAANHDLPRLMGMRLREGRWLEKSDEDRERVLVSAEYAQAVWPEGNAIGRTLNLWEKNLEVVGVLQSMRFEGPTRGPQPFVMEPCSLKCGLIETPLNHFTIHAPGNPKAVKAAIRAAAKSELKDIPFELNSLEELRDKQLAQPRQLFFLSAVMGVLALLLSLSGLYGLSAHIAHSRQKELGLRVVLGATPLKILGVLSKGSLLPLVPGLAAGSLLAFGASRWLVSQNEGFSGLSVSVLLLTGLILALAAALAILVPAIKAMRQNPAEALKGD